MDLFLYSQACQHGLGSHTAIFDNVIVLKDQHLQIPVEVEVRTEASNSGSSTNHRADVAADMRQHWRRKNKFAA